LVVKITRSDDDVKVDAALKEINILKNLPPHENIVKLVDFYYLEQRNIVYTVFKDAGRISLNKLVENPPKNWSDTAKLHVIL